MDGTFVIGRLVEDPEIHEGKEVKVANFRVACQDMDHTEFYRCAAFRQQAEFVGQYLKKGDWVAIFGKMRTRTWEDKEGVKQYRTELRAERVKGMGNKKPESEGSDRAF